MSYAYLNNPETDIEKIVIESPRCIIKPFQVEWIDFEDLTKAFCEANENLYIIPVNDPSVENERAYIEWSIDARKNGKLFECFTFDKITNRLIGSVGISDISAPEPNIGLWIRKELYGKWLGTEVYQAILDWAKVETNLIFLKHGVNPKNTASIRLAEHFSWVLQDEREKGWELKYYIYLK